MEEVNWMAEIIALVIVLIEFTFRVWPTTKNISILDMIYNILKVVPNKKKGGGTF
ncbi:hypothetical protein [Sanyastnella coralliicola]|uniref:hypothetical protein n=1 Tax=Sanyastnella coralliicola TaxID=3069118 RepID=UPI0027B9B9AA|nr:hypothetical protein [Longitalea sp. SCSIO 12813]